MPGLSLVPSPRAGAQAVEQVSAVEARVIGGPRKRDVTRWSDGPVHEL
jgi:hypothetical protein